MKMKSSSWCICLVSSRVCRLTNRCWEVRWQSLLGVAGLILPKTTFLWACILFASVLQSLRLCWKLAAFKKIICIPKKHVQLEKRFVKKLASQNGSVVALLLGKRYFYCRLVARLRRDCPRWLLPEPFPFRWPDYQWQVSAHCDEQLLEPFQCAYYPLG